MKKKKSSFSSSVDVEGAHGTIWTRLRRRTVGWQVQSTCEFSPTLNLWTRVFCWIQTSWGCLVLEGRTPSAKCSVSVASFLESSTLSTWPVPFPQCDFSPPAQTNKPPTQPGRFLICCLAGYVILFPFNFPLRFPSIASSPRYFVKPFEFILLSGVSSISEILRQLITVWYFWPTPALWWDSRSWEGFLLPPARYINPHPLRVPLPNPLLPTSERKMASKGHSRF